MASTRPEVRLIALLVGLAAASVVRGEDGPLTEFERQGMTRNYDEPPRIRKQTKPVYPKSAFDLRLEGVVEVEFIVDARGRVRDGWAIKPKEPVRGGLEAATRDLQQAAVAAVRNWEFEPALKDGRPVPTLARAPMTFTIDNRK